MWVLVEGAAESASLADIEAPGGGALARSSRPACPRAGESGRDSDAAWFGCLVPALSVTLMVNVNVQATVGWRVAGAPGGHGSGGQLTASADTAPAASITARPGTIFRSARLPRDPLPVPKLVAPAPKVNALPLLSA